MNRGSGYRKIFQHPNQYRMFLSLLGELDETYGMETHSYCLLPNHYHLLIRIPRGNLNRAMRHLNRVYTQRYNRSERIDGPLFRGRYKAIVVEKDHYLLEVARYIHQNPVKAGWCTRPEQYAWSSLRYYQEDTVRPSWLDRDTLPC